MIHNDFLPEKLVSRLKKDELCIFLFHGVARNKKSSIRNYAGKHIDCDLFFKYLEFLTFLFEIIIWLNLVFDLSNPSTIDEVIFPVPKNPNFILKVFKLKIKYVQL